MSTGRAPPNARGAEPDDVTPAGADVRSALERILRSPSFEHSGRASDFLRFVVEQTLAGRGHHLKGYVIATAVFGRSPDFDAQGDPLVRVEAGRLRRRLAEYYAREGSTDEVRIDLPRGQYAPQWRFAARRRGRPQADGPLEQGSAAPTVVATSARRWRRLSGVLAASLCVTAAMLGWQRLAAPSRNAPATVPASAAVEASDRFPIIVASFDNLSGEPELDRWAAAMTEEVLLRLDRLEVLVIASSTSWYGGDAATDEGKAGYVLTGSVRSAGDHARITVRLIESESGALLWSSGYNAPRDSAALPALQERIALEIAAVAAPYGPLYEAELQRARRAVKASPDLRDCFAAYYEYRRRPGPAMHRETQSCFESVAARRPELANAWAGLALLYVDEYGFHYHGEPEDGDGALARAQAAVDKARSIDTNGSLVELARARLLYFVDEQEFLRSAERALAMDPDNSQTLAVIGILFSISGDSARGLPLVERAIEASTNPPGYYELARAATRLREGNAEEALEAALHIGTPDWYVMPLFVAAAAGLAGRADIAARAREQLLALDSDFAEHAAERFGRWRFDKPLCDALLRGLAAAGVTFPAAPAASVESVASPLA